MSVSLLMTELPRENLKVSIGRKIFTQRMKWQKWVLEHQQFTPTFSFNPWLAIVDAILFRGLMIPFPFVLLLNLNFPQFRIGMNHQPSHLDPFSPCSFPRSNLLECLIIFLSDSPFGSTEWLPKLDSQITSRFRVLMPIDRVMKSQKPNFDGMIIECCCKFQPFEIGRKLKLAHVM